MWHMANTGRAGEFERLLQDLEQRLARLTRMVRASRAAPAAIDRASYTAAAALTDVADRFRGRAHAVSGQAAELGDEALKAGHDALRKLTREVQQRPLVILAIAVAVGALAAGILARRN